LVAANGTAGAVEHEAITLDAIRPAATFTLPRFLTGCSRHFRRYLTLGILLMVVYALSAAGYLAFVIAGYRAAGDRELVLSWAFVAALASVVLVAWITIVNLAYLLLQIAIAIEDVGLVDACRAVWR